MCNLLIYQFINNSNELMLFGRCMLKCKLVTLQRHLTEIIKMMKYLKSYKSFPSTIIFIYIHIYIYTHLNLKYRYSLILCIKHHTA